MQIKQTQEGAEQKGAKPTPKKYYWILAKLSLTDNNIFTLPTYLLIRGSVKPSEAIHRYLMSKNTNLHAQGKPCDTTCRQRGKTYQTNYRDTRWNYTTVNIIKLRILTDPEYSFLNEVISDMYDADSDQMVSPENVSD